MVNGCQTRIPKSESRTAGSAKVIIFLMNHRWRSSQALQLPLPAGRSVVGDHVEPVIHHDRYEFWEMNSTAGRAAYFTTGLTTILRKSTPVWSPCR
jgi:hypothetical protein